jgi:hypothetical protein
MFQSFGNLFGGKSQPKGGPVYREYKPASPLGGSSPADRKPTYSKVFRWRLPDGVTKEPMSVEIAGTFNHWQKVPLLHDSKVDSWHTTIHNIPGNKTHHYMLFVDGEPAQDKTCDGYAVPQGAQEEQYAIQTARGPRVFMLFAQTK